MAAFKLIPLLFVLFGISQVAAQKNPVLYAGFEYYRHTGFSEDAFMNFSVGTQLYHWKIFAPEVGFDHYTGSLPDRIIYEGPFENRMPVGNFHHGFSANLFTLNPKIKIGKEDAFLTFSPMYHIGRVNARGRYYLLKDNKRLVLEEEQRRSSPISFWSFSIGVEGLAIQMEKYWFSLTLNYTEIIAGDALSLLDFSEYDINANDITTTTIGFGLRFYFNPFPVEND